MRIPDRSPVLPTLALFAALGLLAIAGCSKSSSPTAPAVTRPYRMGFSAIPPKPDFSVQLATLDLMVQRSDAALVLNEVPWDSLLDGVPPDAFVRRNQLGLAQWYRGHGLAIVASVDPCNGLDRSADAGPLVARGRSLTEASIRQVYRDYVVALDTLIRPDYLSVASETNLMRYLAPGPLYAAVKQNAADAAAAIRAYDASVKLFTTVQVDIAWGRHLAGVYEGVAQDRADFPFIQALGLSSYPYLAGWADPDSLPADYFSKLVEGSPIPTLMIEGGWSSVTVSSTATSPDMQRRYIARQGGMLERAGAVAWFQISFTDFDLAFWPSGITPFAYLGLVDKDLVAKPALAAWDAEFAKKRR